MSFRNLLAVKNDTVNNAPKAAASQRFDFWQVEDLLNQCADLIDRSLAERTDLGEIELKTFEAENAIEEKGYAITLLEERLKIGLLTWQHNSLERVLKHVADEYANYNFASSQLEAFERTQPEPAYHAKSDTANLKAQKHKAETEKEKAASEEAWLRQEEPLLKKYYENLITHHAKVSKELNTLIQKHFTPHADGIARLITRDLTDIQERLSAAIIGLRDIFGHDLSKSISEGKIGLSSLEDCAIVVRDAISWMASFKQRDHLDRHPVSLRETMGEDAWARALTSNPPEFSFQLPNPIPNRRHSYRFHSVAAWVVCKHSRPETLAWGMDLKFPDVGAYSRKSGNPDKIDQTRLPICRLGHVKCVSSNADALTFGESSLTNSSPFSFSSDHPSLLTIVKAPARHFGPVTIDDIIISYYLRAQPL